MERRWHDDILARDAALECLHAVALVFRHVVPAVVDAPIVLSFNIRGDYVLPIWYHEVDIRWRNIHRILAIVAWVFGVVRIWRIDRLLQLLQILGVRPLFVPVSCTFFFFRLFNVS